ncbi:MAG: LON peptidase substrate-binding domain-containing protein, partial [Planctomycetes bacterium]|nr:LON peptidase substrate-binding domain-containing protein [Planctomycetota bacterium]
MATKIIRIREAAPAPPRPASEEFTLPILPVRDVVLYPSMLSPLVVTDAESIRLIDDALSTSKHFGHVTVKEAGEKRISLGDLYEHGTRAEILKMLKFPDGSVRILVQGIDRIRILGAAKRSPYLVARVRTLPDPVDAGDEIAAHIRSVTGQFLKMLKLAPYLPEELQVAVMNVNDPVKLAYPIASNLNLTPQDKQRLLEMDPVRDRLAH